MSEDTLCLFTNELPDLHYFKVGIGRREPRLFATLEDSLGMKAIMGFGFDLIESIDILDAHKDESLIMRLSMNHGVMFAESRMCYFLPKQFEQLKEDYFVMKLSGVKQ